MLHRAISFILLSIIIFPPSACFCQLSVKGKIYNAKGDELIPYATIRNISKQKNNVSDLGGNYKIEAKEGDTLIFSSTSYFEDTITTDYFMLHNAYDISLKPRSANLEAVTVNSDNYYRDSMERHDLYKDAYKKTEVIDKDPSGAFGIKLSVVELVTSREKEKEKRTLRKKIEKEDQDDYIDGKFSAGYVSKLTSLKEDSLKEFMLTYRPSYKFCRKASSQDMLIYVNDCMKKYIKRKERKRANESAG